MVERGSRVGLKNINYRILSSHKEGTVNHPSTVLEQAEEDNDPTYMPTGPEPESKPKGKSKVKVDSLPLIKLGGEAMCGTCAGKDRIFCTIEAAVIAEWEEKAKAGEAVFSNLPACLECEASIVPCIIPRVRRICIGLGHTVETVAVLSLGKTLISRMRSLLNQQEDNTDQITRIAEAVWHIEDQFRKDKTYRPPLRSPRGTIYEISDENEVIQEIEELQAEKENSVAFVSAFT